MYIGDYMGETVLLINNENGIGGGWWRIADGLLQPGRYWLQALERSAFHRGFREREVVVSGLAHIKAGECILNHGYVPEHWARFGLGTLMKV
jgi:hypothetical protein